MVGKDEMLNKWREMPTKKRMLIAGVGGSTLVVIAGVMFGSPAAPELKPNAGKSISNFTLPVDKDISMEQLAASVKSIRDGQDEDRIARKRLEEIVLAKNESTKADLVTDDVVRELRDMRAELETLKAIKKSSESLVSLDAALPQDGEISSSQTRLPARVEQVRVVPQIRISGGKIKEGAKDESVESEKDLPLYLPVGSNFEGVLLNGMDAPTSGATRQNPVPAIIRLDTDAILPSKHRYDVRECFTLVSGFGVLSTERAQLQTVSISCIKTDGTVIESKLEGYVVGEDGKVGLRGRLVSKQGQLLAKGFATGFFAGIGQALAPMSVPQLNVNPGATAQYQSANISQMVTAGTAQGLQQTARSISQFYLDMAKEMFPVIEIDAMRRVTIVLVKGTALSMVGS